MIEIFNMSDDEGFVLSSKAQIPTPKTASGDECHSNSASVAAAPCIKMNQRKQRVRRRNRPPSFSTCFTGQLLQHILKRGHLNELEASQVTRQIAEALQFMHGKGLAHRDLKPENILCQSESNLLPIKLCDFDLASAMRHAGISTMTTPALSTPVGSAEFMAPEVVDAWVLERDKGDCVNYDKRCDLWSLGVIIYIMLCGYPPFYGRCEEPKCGWEDGKYCRDCQQLLFSRIRDGEFTFPSPEWDTISDDAKDLISHLLVCDSRSRYSADQVLQHKWIRYPAPQTALTTAFMLLRDNSVKNLQTFTNEALSISKMLNVEQNKFNMNNKIESRPTSLFCSNKNQLDDDELRQPPLMEDVLVRCVQSILFEKSLKSPSCGKFGQQPVRNSQDALTKLSFCTNGSSCGLEYKLQIGAIEHFPKTFDSFSSSSNSTCFDQFMNQNQFYLDED